MTARGDAMREDPWRGRHRILLLFLIISTLCAYGNILNVYFIKDDLAISVLTAGGQEFDSRSWFEQLIWPTARTHDDIFRPLPPSMWAADFLLFGPDPVAFRLGNVLFHGLNAILLYWLVNRLTGFRNPLAGFFAGLLFVLYPLHGEAVVWCTQRFVIMGLGLSLLALISYDVYLHDQRRRFFVLTWVVVALCTLTKEIGITLPGPLCVMALLCGPPRPLSRRVRQAGMVVLVGALFIAAYFAVRWTIFGRLTGGYSGWPTMQDYARDNDIFERLPQSLHACALPVNRSLGFPSWALPALIVLQCAAAAAALVSLLAACLRSARARALVVVAVAMALTSFLPTIWIFYVDPDLINGRFGYHAIAPLIALMATFLIQPWARLRRSKVQTLRIAGACLLAIAYATILQVNLGAYHRGGAQVRIIQEDLIREARAGGRDAVYAVFQVPHQCFGCPTVDDYLRVLTQPPLVREPVLAFPFVVERDAAWPAILEGRKGPEGLEALRRRGRSQGDPRPVHYFEARAWPTSLRPLFGTPEPAQGDAPATPLSPADGAVLPCPGPEPLFIFEAAAEQQRFRLHVSVPGRQASYLFEVGVNAERAGQEVRYRLSAGDLAREDLDPWSALTSQGLPINPLPVQWQIEALGPGDLGIAVSASQRLVIIDDPARR